MPVINRRGRPLRSKIPRLGIVRLGFKVRNKSGEGTHPQAADHFVLRPEGDSPDETIEYALPVAKFYGNEPKELSPVIIPVEDEEVFASHYYRLYTGTWKLTCWGDGEKAERKIDVEATKEAGGEAIPASRTTKTMQIKTITCPCPLLESKECREHMYLRFMLPDVPGLGAWQLSTRSPNSIDHVLGCFDMIRAVTKSPAFPNGRIAGIPLKLSLVREQVPSMEGTRWVYLLNLEPIDVVPLAEFRRKLVSYSMPALPEPEFDETDGAEIPFEEPERIEGAVVMPAAADPAPAAAAEDSPPVAEASATVVEGTSRPVPEDAPADPPSTGEKLDHNAVFKFAKDQCGYSPQKVPTILGSNKESLSLINFLAEGNSFADAIEKIRQYHQMDKGGR